MLFQNPCVLASAALGGVDDERAFFKGDAGQASGDDVDFVSKQNVGPQVHVARLQAIADEAGSAGEIERGLGNVVARVGLDLAGELFALAGGGVRADQHAVAAAFADGLDDQLVEIGEDVLALLVFGEQIGFDVGEDGVFVEVVADHARARRRRRPCRRRGRCRRRW